MAFRDRRGAGKWHGAREMRVRRDRAGGRRGGDFARSSRRRGAFCAADMAFGLLIQAHLVGLDMPDDLAVFADEELAGVAEADDDAVVAAAAGEEADRVAGQ